MARNNIVIKYYESASENLSGKTIQPRIHFIENIVDEASALMYGLKARARISWYARGWR